MASQVGALASALVLGSLLIFLNSSRTYYQKVDPASVEGKANVTQDKFFHENGQVKTEQAKGKFEGVDTNTYHVWQNTDPHSTSRFALEPVPVECAVDVRARDVRVRVIECFFIVECHDVIFPGSNDA